MRRREHVAKAIRALESHGARIDHITQTKHIKIGFATPTGRGQVTVAATPSDWRADRNIESDIRHKLAEMASRRNDTGAPRLGRPGGICIDGSSLERTRQAPLPTRSHDRRPAFQNPGGHSSAGRSIPIKTRKRRIEVPPTRTEPAAMAQKILTEMEDFVIWELGTAVARKSDRWVGIIARDAVGFPYLRGHRSVSKTGLGTRFQIWANRSPSEDRRRLWKSRNDFISSLSEIAQTYANGMPERPRLIEAAWEFITDVLPKVAASMRRRCFLHEWPPCVLNVKQFIDDEPGLPE